MKNKMSKTIILSCLALVIGATALIFASQSPNHVTVKAGGDIYSLGDRESDTDLLAAMPNLPGPQILIPEGVPWETLTIDNADPNLPLITIHASFPHYSKERLMERAVLVVRGRIIDRTEAFVVENLTTGSRSVFRDYILEVHEIMRGQTSFGEIPIRIRGGHAGEMVLIADYTPGLQQGEEYLLFLTIASGGPYDTPGYYYYILGGNQGVFQIERNDSIQGFGADSVHNFTQYSGDYNFSLTEARMQLDIVNTQVPIKTAEDFRQEGIANLRHNASPEGILDISEEYLEEWIQRILSAPIHPARIVE